MKKMLRILFVTLFVLVAVITACGFTKPKYKPFVIKDFKGFYPQPGVIIAVHEGTGFITFKDCFEREWTIRNMDEPWHVGDLVNAVMNGHGTNQVYDDTISMMKCFGNISGS